MPRGPAGSDRTPRLPSSARDRCARAGAPPETPAVCQARAATFAALSAFTISRQNAGRSGGVREEIRLRSEEHTSELQSRGHLVCRLLLEKKKKHDEDHQCIQPARPTI